MNDTDRANFLAGILEPHREKAEKALQLIETGTAQSSIYNVDFKDAKRVLDRSINASVALKAFMDSTPLYSLPENVRTVYFDTRPNFVRDAIAASKKLAKTKVQHPAVDVMRSFVATILPLALEMEELKKNIVKGHKPNVEAEARKLQKALTVDSMPRAQCGCCFGDQAVLPNGNMHDHGYTRPREWMKTSSCYGRDFGSLAASVGGPKYMLGLLIRSEASIMEAIANLKTVTKLSVEVGSEHKNGMRVPVLKDIEVGHKDFELIRNRRILQQEMNLKHCRADMATFYKIVAEWKPGYEFKG